MKNIKSLLEEIGINLHNDDGQIKTVSEIMNELVDKWEEID